MPPVKYDLEFASTVPPELCFVRKHWLHQGVLPDALQAELRKKAFALKAADKELYVLDLDVMSAVMLHKRVHKRHARRFWQVPHHEANGERVFDWASYYTNRNRGTAKDRAEDPTCKYLVRTPPAFDIWN